jgi:hypothetical protein
MQEAFEEFKDRPFRERRPYSFHLLRSAGVLAVVTLAELVAGGSQTDRFLSLTEYEAPGVMMYGLYRGMIATNNSLEMDETGDNEKQV